MKKNILILACITTAFVYGMEESQSFNVQLYGVNINLYKGSIAQAAGRVGLIVVGENQQSILQIPSFNNPLDVGRTWIVENNILYEKSKHDESGSDDDTPKMKRAFDNPGIWKQAQKKIVTSQIICILEPQIVQGTYFCKKTDKFVDNSFIYLVARPSFHPVSLRNLRFVGEDAVEEASHDLTMCYKTVLNEGLKIVEKKENKSVAVPTLSTEIGFPREKAAPIAVAAIIDFIMNNQQGYDSIELFVRKRSEFALYKELLQACVQK